MKCSLDKIPIDSKKHCIIDTARSVIIFKRQEPIPLCEIELKLLVYLADNRGVIMSKDDIILHLWPKGTASDYNLVQVIHKVRKAMKQCKQDKSIVTLRGQGYCLVPAEKLLDGLSTHFSAMPLMSFRGLIVFFVALLLSIITIALIYHGHLFDKAELLFS